MPKYEGKIAFIPVSLDRSVDETRKFVSANGLKFDVYAKPPNEVLASLNIRYIPTLLFVSSTGQIVSTVVGTKPDAEMIKLLDSLIK